MSLTVQGSPPRVRGKACRCPPLDTNQRITPARAGKSAAVAKRQLFKGDHPRVCGEKLPDGRLTTREKGSPPRVRGKVGRRRSKNRRTEDHPRVCGEKACGRASPRGAKGSPPRVRGKDFIMSPMNCPLGITPACAGKSGSSCYPAGIPWDHPRVCGEKQTPKGTAHGRPGSPPRVRGKAAHR